MVPIASRGRKTHAMRPQNTCGPWPGSGDGCDGPPGRASGSRRQVECEQTAASGHARPASIHKHAPVPAGRRRDLQAQVLLRSGDHVAARCRAPVRDADVWEPEREVMEWQLGPDLEAALHRVDSGQAEGVEQAPGGLVHDLALVPGREACATVGGGGRVERMTYVVDRDDAV